MKLKAHLSLILCTLLAVLAILFGGHATPKAQDSCNFVTNSYHQRVSWSASVPVVMYLDASVPAAYTSAIQAAMDTWNAKLGRKVLVLGGWTKSDAPKKDGANVIYWLKNWEPERAGFEQARTTIYWANDVISEADVRINATGVFAYSTLQAPMMGQVDFQSLILHEFGHVLGLQHTEQPESVMVKTLRSDDLRRTPSEFDLKSLHCEYHP
jgi:hypothetical protein